ERRDQRRGKFVERPEQRIDPRPRTVLLEFFGHRTGGGQTRHFVVRIDCEWHEHGRDTVAKRIGFAGRAQAYGYQRREFETPRPNTRRAEIAVQPSRENCENDIVHSPPAEEADTSDALHRQTREVEDPARADRRI